MIAATVSASALAQHLDCSRTYIGKLEAEGVIQRQGDGFPLDQSRVAYLRYLRRERRQSPRGEADADFQRAKAELIRLRIAEKQRHLIPLEEAVGQMEEFGRPVHIAPVGVRGPVRWSGTGCSSRHRPSGVRSARRDIRSRDQAGGSARRAATG